MKSGGGARTGGRGEGCSVSCRREGPEGKGWPPGMCHVGGLVVRCRFSSSTRGAVVCLLTSLLWWRREALGEGPPRCSAWVN